MNGSGSLEVEIGEVVTVSERVKRLRLVPITASVLPAFSAGSHVLVTIPGQRKQFRNAYSLMGSLFDNRSYQISVLKTEQSRGGSTYLHEAARPGLRLSISHPVNLFSLARLGRKHIFVAGGIGITPFLSMMQELNARNVPFELHYSVRSWKQAAYLDEVSRAYRDRVHIYETGIAKRFSMDFILRGQPLGTHLYVCGPSQMIEDVLQAGREAGWPTGHLHSERFAAGSEGQPFTVVLARSNRTLPVNEHESLLEALEAAGVAAPFLCRGGSCGQCETRVLACDRHLIHHDHVLSPAERASGSKIMICVSRAAGGNLVLDL